MTAAIILTGQIRSPTMLRTAVPSPPGPGSGPAHPSAATLSIALDDIRPLGLLASEAGISFADILQTLDLSPQVFDDPRVDSVALADYFRILERLAIAANDEAWGLSTRPLLPGATGLVLSNLANCRTLFEAMKAVANAYNVLHGGAYNRVELRQDCLAYIIDDSHFPYALSTDSAQVRLTMECVLIFLHGMLTLIAGDELHGLLKKVYTKDARLAQRRAHMDFWPVPIGWRSRHYALFYDLSAMSMPLARGNLVPSSQAIYRKVIDLIECTQAGASRQRSLLERLTEVFDQNIYDQHAVAKKLGLSVATLRRRLREAGQPGFRVLRERALNQAAKLLLAQRCHPSEVADELGFCDLRSFNRAFRRWNGITPTAYARAAIAR